MPCGRQRSANSFARHGPEAVIPAQAGIPKRAGNTLSILRRQADNWLIARDANMLAVVSK
jgi:hypothetical protein